MASVNDVLASNLADSLNKKFKDNKVAYFLDGTDNTPTDIKDFISTGSSMLDLAISNKPDGGIAVGRITEINGLESSGKSLLGAHMLAETQKKGGVAVYIDTETSVSQEFMQVIGIDMNKQLIEAGLKVYNNEVDIRCVDWFKLENNIKKDWCINVGSCDLRYDANLKLDDNEYLQSTLTKMYQHANKGIIAIFASDQSEIKDDVLLGQQCV